MIVAGIGARAGCDAAELALLLAEAARLARQAPTLLAVPWFRAGMPGLEGLGLPVCVVSETALLSVQDRCVTRSERALAATGMESVAEACALAAAGPAATLMLRRIASASATCALAR